MGGAHAITQKPCDVIIESRSKSVGIDISVNESEPFSEECGWGRDESC